MGPKHPKPTPRDHVTLDRGTHPLSSAPFNITWGEVELIPTTETVTLQRVLEFLEIKRKFTEANPITRKQARLERDEVHRGQNLLLASEIVASFPPGTKGRLEGGNRLLLLPEPESTQEAHPQDEDLPRTVIDQEDIEEPEVEEIPIVYVSKYTPTEELLYVKPLEDEPITTKVSKNLYAILTPHLDSKKAVYNTFHDRIVKYTPESTIRPYVLIATGLPKGVEKEIHNTDIFPHSALIYKNKGLSRRIYIPYRPHPFQLERLDHILRKYRITVAIV